METTKENKSRFSIERFEGIMKDVNITWPEINKILEFDVETMLKDTSRTPMRNVIRKACSIVGLNDTDYVMMKSNNYVINRIVTDLTDTRIDTSIIDADVIDIYIKESEWNYTTLASLMGKKYTFYAGPKNYLSNTKKICKDDLDTLCWALQCKKSDICYVDATGYENIPIRVINQRQKYKINPDTLSELSDKIDEICKQANIPEWFLVKDQLISYEMVNILCRAIKRVIRTNIDPKKLCINYTEEPTHTKVTSKTITTTKKEKEVIITVNENEGDRVMENKTIDTENKEYPFITRRNTGYTNNRNNYNRNNASSFMEDVFYKIDRMSDDELNKVEEYIAGIKKLRELKNSLLNN